MPRAGSSANHSFILSGDLVPANLTIRLGMSQLSMPSDRNLWVRLYPEASGASAPLWHGNGPRKTWAVSFVCLGGVVMARVIPSLGKSQHRLPSSICVVSCARSLQPPRVSWAPGAGLQVKSSWVCQSCLPKYLPQASWPLVTPAETIGKATGIFAGRAVT